MVFDTLGVTFEHLISTIQIQFDLQGGCHSHKDVPLPFDEHMAGALHVWLLVTDEGLSGQDLACTLLPEPAFSTVLSKRAITTRCFDVGKAHVE